MPHNPYKIQAGKSSVNLRHDQGQNGWNNSIVIDTTVGNPEGGYMDCDATCYDIMQQELGSGSYDSTTSTHAELNAIADALANQHQISDIAHIIISSPPCKACAFVLELLGLIGNVVTTKKIYKHATSSWRWPDALKARALFDANEWQTIRGYFAGSGLTEDEIRDKMVSVVQSKSAF